MHNEVLISEDTNDTALIPSRKKTCLALLLTREKKLKPWGLTSLSYVDIKNVTLKKVLMLF